MTRYFQLTVFVLCAQLIVLADARTVDAREPGARLEAAGEQGLRFVVTPSFNGNGTISPNTPQSVDVAQTATFTLAPASGFTVESVTGTCGGTLVGFVFTTLPVVADCTVIANFGLPILSPDKSSLTFGVESNGTSFVSKTSAHIVRLTQTRQGTSAWTVASNQPWLKVDRASGSGPGEIAVSVEPAPNVPVSGVVTGVLTIIFSSSAPVNIVVRLNVLPVGNTAPPSGNVDSPLDNSNGVTGAMPFGGWALDDIEVTRVMICRDAVAGEFAPVDPNCGTTQSIFIGIPLFIDGARPDVATAFSAHPLNTRAGWGYMVLTNELPNQGNGTYRFTVWAEDRDGNVTQIGERTITCTNATATRPFGTLDTPTQGGVASGATFYNFGWALTPQPKTIPFDGSTINVLIDGASVGTVLYNNFRPDVAAIFPGLNNTNGAVGLRAIDTTLLTNGIHTISWIVADDQGATEGIGSRYFTVSNGASGVTEGPISSRVSVEGLRSDVPWMVGHRGWDLTSPLEVYSPGDAGVFVVHGEEVGRVELLVGAGIPFLENRTRYEGYLQVGGTLAALPPGAQIDATTGRFTWAPGLGFVGAYDLVFIRSVDGVPAARRNVRIVLQPKG